MNTTLLGSLRGFRRFLFLPLAFLFCLLFWFSANHEIFPQSRASLSFAFGLLGVLIIFFCFLSALSIPLIFLFRKRPHPLVWQTALLGISIAGIWILIVGYLPQNLPTGSDQLRFDSNLWKNSESAPLPQDLVTLRQKMLKDAVEDILPGKSKEEIIDLLGPSTETPNFRGRYDLIYVLGPERDSIFGIDYEWLLIHLKDGKFQKYSIHSD